MDCDCGIRHRRTQPHVRLLRTRPRPRTDERTSRVSPVWGSFGSQAVLSVSGDLQLHTSKRATPASEGPIRNPKLCLVLDCNTNHRAIQVPELSPLRGTANTVRFRLLFKGAIWKNEVFELR